MVNQHDARQSPAPQVVGRHAQINSQFVGGDVRHPMALLVGTETPVIDTRPDHQRHAHAGPYTSIRTQTAPDWKPIPGPLRHIDNGWPPQRYPHQPTQQCQRPRKPALPATERVVCVNDQLVGVGCRHSLTPLSGLTQRARLPLRCMTACGNATTVVQVLISQYASGYQTIQ